MTLDTNLNTPPYYDDFDANNNFHRILFKPSVALQARELTQLQTILQDQVEKFGKHMFKDGSIISGVAIKFDDRYDYVKIRDTFTNGASFDIGSFVGYTVRNSLGAAGVIVNTLAGLESNYDATNAITRKNSQLNTLYVKYSNTASNDTKTFAASETLTIESSTGVVIGNITVSNTDTAPIGFGYAMSVSDGVIFQKGFFVTVTPQTLIVNNYFTSSDGAPDNRSVGFTTTESIVTSSTDDRLLDNAFGSPNYAAPGADRLKLTASLIIRPTGDTSNTNHFSSIVDFASGRPIVINRTQYNELGDQLAARTFEESGHYVVSPFHLNVKNIAGNTTHLNLEVSEGLGYVSGYRVEYLDKFNTPLRRGTDTKLLQSQSLSTSIGSYVFINEYAGEFRFDVIDSVELHNVTRTAISSNVSLLSTAYNSSTRIGTANVIGIRFDSGVAGSATARYKLYLTNISMDAGYNFSSVRSIIDRSGVPSTLGIADVILEVEPATGASIAVLQEAEKSTLIYPFNQQAVKNLTNSSYTFRSRRAGLTFSNNGTTTLTLPTASGTGAEVFPYSVGLLSEQFEGEFLVIATTSANSIAKSGTVSVNTTSSNVVGDGSASFLSDYRVGDYITAGTAGIRNITSITNNTLLTVTSPFNSLASGQTHVRTIPAGSIIPFVNRPEASISITTATTATLNLGTGTGGLSSTFDAAVYYNTRKGGSGGGSTTTQKTKTVNKNRFVRLKLSDNPGSVTGPWCLGLPDVIKINAVYLNDGTTYSNTTPNLSSFFTLDNGQRDGFYNLAYLRLNPDFNLNLYSSNTITVDLDHFTADQDSGGKGYFTVQSYPVLDPVANSTTITTQEIPTFVSPINGIKYDLRNSIDFRLYAANTAVSSTTVAGGTENPATTVNFRVAATSSSSNSYVIVPDTNVTTDYDYYLARFDTVYMTPQGKVVILEGEPSTTPNRRPTPSSGMTLGNIFVTQYPSLDTKTAYAARRTDLAVRVNVDQQRRFTMRDIGVLKNRIENLEYYVSLSLVEQNLKDKAITNSAGLDRFKNGFIVDTFLDHSVGDTDDPSYVINLDPQRAEIRAVVRTTRPSLEYNSTGSSNITRTGTSFTLPYANSAYISQPYASRARSLSDLTIYSWVGSIETVPLFGKPDVVVPIEPPPGVYIDVNTPGGGWDSWNGDNSVSPGHTDPPGVAEGFSENAVSDSNNPSDGPGGIGADAPGNDGSQDGNSSSSGDTGGTV